MVQGYFEQQNAAIAAQNETIAQAVPTVGVYAVNRVIKHGEQIKPEDVVVIQYAEPFLPEGVFRTEEELFPEGLDEYRVVLRQMEPNEPVLDVKVTEPGQVAGIAALLSRGMRAFAIEVDVASGVSGFLTPGDRVDVYWTGRVDGFDSTVSGEFTTLIDAGLKIVAIDQTSESGRTGATIARTVTLEVTPDQVAALAQAQSTGDLYLSLVGIEDDTIASEIEVDQARLLGLVQREPEAPVVEEQVEVERVCTIRARRGAEVVEVQSRVANNTLCLTRRTAASYLPEV